MKSTSPRNRQRESIYEMYKSRGRRNSNLWLVYSEKTNRDWVLTSDRELIHWICLLEFERTIRTFDLRPDSVLSHDAEEPRSTELDAIVEYRDGRREWREIKADIDESDDRQRSQFQAQAAAAQHQGFDYRIFSDKDLRSLAHLAARWLEALAFAAQLRDQMCTPAIKRLRHTLRDNMSGNVGELLQALEAHDPMLVAGLLVRLAAHGEVTLDLSTRGFGRKTQWQFYGT